MRGLRLGILFVLFCQAPLIEASNGKRTLDIVVDVGVSSQSESFALLSNGDVYAWGYNEFGDLGVGPKLVSASFPARVLTPGPSEGLLRWDGVPVCAFPAFGGRKEAWCWSLSLFADFLGASHTPGGVFSIKFPEAAKSLTNIGPNLVMFADSGLAYWAAPSPGVTGPVWKPLVFPEKVRTHRGPYVLLDDGRLYTVHNSPTSGSPILNEISVPGPVSQFAYFYDPRESLCVVALTDASNGIWCRGRNQFGEVGVGDHVPHPDFVPVWLNVSVAQIEGDGGRFCAVITKSGSSGLYCWGRNHRGQIGLGHIGAADAPVYVPLSGSVRKVSLSQWTTFAFLQDGSLWGWGYNEFAALAVGDTYDRWSPTELADKTDGWIGSAVGFGNDHNCLINQIGLLKCWGLNIYGQTGTGKFDSLVGSGENLRAISFVEF